MMLRLCWLDNVDQYWPDMSDRSFFFPLNLNADKGTVSYSSYSSLPTLAPLFTRVSQITEHASQCGLELSRVSNLPSLQFVSRNWPQNFSFGSALVNTEKPKRVGEQRGARVWQGAFMNRAQI